MNIPTPHPTPEEDKLASALRNHGIALIQQYNDGHKHVDIYIPDAKLNIEVDGMQHYTNPSQILSDLEREHYADTSGHHTIHIPNFVIQNEHFNEVVDALVEVILINKIGALMKAATKNGSVRGGRSSSPGVSRRNTRRSRTVPAQQCR